MLTFDFMHYPYLVCMLFWHAIPTTFIFVSLVCISLVRNALVNCSALIVFVSPWSHIKT